MPTLNDYPQETRSEAMRVRKEVSDLHQQLIAWNLVVWTAGNVSQRLHSADLMVIKPSGIRYENLTPESMVVCDLEGNVVDGEEAPSSDTASHAYIYRMMPEVYGVVHTHSTYATAWAATGKNIPCVLTMMGDEFGGEIPIGPFRLIGSEAIGEGVVETLKKYPKSPAVIMQNHGPFTIGRSAEAAVKAAAMTEEVAHTVWAAQMIGGVIPIPQEDIDRLNDRYQNVYGQQGK
ncbi:L-ribulose-5-phosphate 4-epimerase [Scardovia wiggsiae]|uniref:L-ribulose-5-phosphate 4-epimerase n=1 Tax=Scardovia wiggsiae TaxID=230143 RepID=UPI00374FC2F8